MDVFAYLYGVTGILNALAYYPQIRKLLREHSGAEAISLQTYQMWIFGNVVAVSYAAHTINYHLLFVSVIGLLGNMAVYFLTMRSRILAKRYASVRLEVVEVPTDVE